MYIFINTTTILSNESKYSSVSNIGMTCVYDSVCVCYMNSLYNNEQSLSC